MIPLDLISSAMRLAIGDGSWMPSDADLRRAVGSIYYAYFLALRLTVADLWIGPNPSDKLYGSWVQAFRSLQHERVRKICSNPEFMMRFPEAIRLFAKEIVLAQQKRHKADYDPGETFSAFDVVDDAEKATKIIQDFMNAPRDDKLAFVTLIALPERKV